MAIHVVLYQREIPSNTANISRICAATDTALHLIRPLGFSTDEKMLEQAGLDFWQSVNITYYDSLDDFFHKIKVSFTISRPLVKITIHPLILVTDRRNIILYLEKNQRVYQKIY